MKDSSFLYVTILPGLVAMGVLVLVINYFLIYHVNLRGHVFKWLCVLMGRSFL